MSTGFCLPITEALAAPFRRVSSLDATCKRPQKIPGRRSFYSTDRRSPVLDLRSTSAAAAAATAAALNDTGKFQNVTFSEAENYRVSTVT